MPNEYYTPTGTPGTAAQGASSPMRAEFNLLKAAFDLLPTLAGKARALVRVNDAETGLQSDAGISFDGTDLTVATIGDVTPGVVNGTCKEVFKTANGTLTAAQCAGTIVSNYGMTDADCTIDLPTAAAGLAFVCVLPAVRARFFKLHCPAAQADKIYLLGVAGSDDGNVGVASGYATASACSMFTFKASDGGYDWFCVPLFGAWVAS